MNRHLWKGFAAIVGLVALAILVSTPGSHPMAQIAKARANLISTSLIGDLAPNATQMCGRTPVIVKGTCASILRATGTPIGYAGSMPTVPQTAWTFTVENWLKGSGPGSITVVDAGAIVGGVATELEGSPILNVGDRYILFLKVWPNGENASPGDGTSGPAILAGEYSPFDPIQGKVLLRSGQALAATDTIQTAAPSPYTSGNQIFGVSETAATATIQQGVIDGSHLDDPAP